MIANCVSSFWSPGNCGSAFLQIDVGRSSWPVDHSYLTLLPTTTLMTPADAKIDKNRSGVRMFKEGNGVSSFTCAEHPRLEMPGVLKVDGLSCLFVFRRGLLGFCPGGEVGPHQAHLQPALQQARPVWPLLHPDPHSPGRRLRRGKAGLSSKSGKDLHESGLHSKTGHPKDFLAKPDVKREIQEKPPTLFLLFS